MQISLLYIMAEKFHMLKGKLLIPMKQMHRKMKIRIRGELWVLPFIKQGKAAPAQELADIVEYGGQDHRLILNQLGIGTHYHSANSLRTNKRYVIIFRETS